MIPVPMMHHPFVKMGKASGFAGTVSARASLAGPTAMKRTTKCVFGFASLGALVGACMAVLFRDVPTAYPIFVFSIGSGLLLGALTGLASAFSSGRFATVRCLLAISIPALTAMMFVAPPHRGKGESAGWAMLYSVGAVVAIVMAVLLAYLGHRRVPRTPPTPPGR